MKPITFINNKTREILELGTLGDDYVLAKKNFGTVEGKVNLTQYIDLIGSHVDSTALAPRDLMFIGFIKNANRNLVAKRKLYLKKFFNPQNGYTILYDEYAISFVPIQTVVDSTEERENRDIYYRFAIKGTAYDPLFRLKKDKIVQEAKIKPTVLFPLKIGKKGLSFGYIPSESIENVINQGDVDVGFVLKIDASKGEVTNPKLTNNNTGEFIELILQMSRGDKIEISTESGNKYAYLIRGSSRIDIFKYVTTASTMSMKLAKGRNNISITAKGNTVNMEAKITYSPRFLEV